VKIVKQRTVAELAEIANRDEIKVQVGNMTAYASAVDEPWDNCQWTKFAGMMVDFIKETLRTPEGREKFEKAKAEYRRERSRKSLSLAANGKEAT
jgi:hypothetical protein